MHWNSWSHLKSQLLIASESDNHPHVREERPNLFISASLESTEIEFLDLLYGIVKATKPLGVLETGTRFGLSTAALAYALKENVRRNHRPKLYTMESSVQSAEKAERLLKKCGLNDMVTVYVGDSLRSISAIDSRMKFDFVYFDSSRLQRLKEFDLLRERNLFGKACLVAFHDTSRRRAASAPAETSQQAQYLSGLDRIAATCKQRLDFSLSRGLTVMAL